MKLTLCLLTLYLVFASCETSFLSPETPPELPENLSKYPLKVVIDFITSLWGHYGLSQPKQIIDQCLDKRAAALYLETLFTFHQSLVDAVARDSVHYDLDMAKIYALYLLEKDSIDCVKATQDLDDLLEALGANRDPVSANIASSLYLQAHYAQMLEDYVPIMGGFKTGDFSASGAAYGALQKKIVDSVKEEGIADLAHIGFSNGFYLGLDLDLPSDSLAVWDNTTAGYDLELMIGGAKAVADGNWWDSYDNLEKYWQEKGEAIYNKIPASVWEAFEASNDNKRVTERLGIDVLSKEFGEMIVEWIKEHPFRYHAHATEMLKSFEGYDFKSAGILHASFAKEVAKSK